MSPALATLTLLTLPILTPQDKGEQPSRSLATRSLAKGDLERARSEFERIVAREPNDGVSWFQLATCAHRAGDVDLALDAYEHAKAVSGVAAQANYNAACLHARAGRLDEAWMRLTAAVDAGLAPRGLVATDPDLDALRMDERFAALLARVPLVPKPDPSAAITFEQADAEVLWVFESDTGLDRYGWQSECVGDVTGDGIAEILTGAPNSFEGAQRGGKAWLLSGADGSVVRTHVGDEPGGNLGFRCKAALDIDLDGVSDYFVTAPGGNSLDGSVPPGDAGLAYPGHAFVFSGKTGEELWFLAAEGTSDRFGFDAGSIGDVNGDGVPELIIGAPGHDQNAEDAGRVYIFSGKTGEIFRVHDGTRALERLGSAIGPLGDLDGDGFDDYVVGAPGAGAGGGGCAYVYSGKSGERLHVLDPAVDEPDACALEFGRFFASSAGDLDGDGKDDIYVADCFDHTLALAAGRVYLYSGASGVLLYSLAGTDSNDWYGIGRGLHEDFDGDGRPDLIVAALSSSDGAFNAGRVDILSGRDGSRVRSYTCTVPFQALGYDAHPVGDVDGDGVGDYFFCGSWGPWRQDLRCRGVLVRGQGAPRTESEEG